MTVTRDGDTRMPEATGVAEFTGAPCPGYTITVRCSDPSGNASTGTTTVTVTH